MHPQARKIISSLEQLPSNWRIVPTFGKRPLGGKQWQHKTYSPKQLQTELIRTKCKIWSGKRYTRVTGVAIVCGDNQPQGHIIAIDCDGLHAWGQILILTEKLEEEEIKEIAPQKLCDRALAYLPPTVAFTSGGKYKCQFLYLIPQHKSITSSKISNLEFRGKNHVSVLPPSYHPEGRYYQWVPGCSPQEKQVAIAPQWVITQMSKQKEKATCLPQEKYNRRYGVNRYQLYPDIETNIQAALTFVEVIHPRFADDYITWIQVGMALKSVSPTLLEAWDTWSQLSPKYKPGECAYKWQSFRRTGITIRTLSKFANLS
ncbi:bifunctional DNA primase/polymerase [Chlorogloeopsis sp. ULAP02]|uniref:bifunctional DNA primase/polymerase n=1 Tax=Chlorogloeopsis sp. ULAP02 TaxID=3107926 RepID=UPI003136D2BD